jgi:Glycosyl hydrolases family 31
MMPPQALAVLATLVSFAQHGNRIEMQLDRGSAELVWISPSSFHFRRTLDGPLQAAAPEPKTEAVTVAIDDTPSAVRLRSKRIDVAIQKRGLLVAVHRVDGAALMADLSEPKPEGALVSWEREAQTGARFYGLGPLVDPLLDLRGIVDSQVPFLISTAGYGEYHNGAGAFRFDFTTAGAYKVMAPQVDYYFYFGPLPKEIFQEHKGISDLAALPARRRPASWDALRDDLLGAVHQAMSSVAPPRFNLAAYAGAPEELLQRARQFGSLVPGVNTGIVPLSPFRGQLNSFFDIYQVEAAEQGHPIWHALPYQFPDDAECARHADEFMLGDEMLIAPIYESGNKRPVYLPPGNWTSLETNQEYAGRASIMVETNVLPVFARNGAILPLDSGGGIGLHYFPKLGGEFFLLQKDLGAYTQVHAAPAADGMRLEIESKKDCDYQWVVHHVERPANVGFEDQQYQGVTAVTALADRTWLYDAAVKNLIVRVRVKAGEDRIINLSW